MRTSSDSDCAHSHGTALPNSGWSSGRSRRTKPPPWQTGQTSSLVSSACCELGAAELAVAAEELGAGTAALARISSSLFTLASLRCPAFEYSRGVAPGALVEQGRLAQGLL